MGICQDALKQGSDKLNVAYTPLIEELSRVIANLQKAKQDPTNWYDPIHDRHVNLVRMLNDLGTTRDQQLRSLRDKVDKDCVEKVEFLQEIMDATVAYITNGLSVILPKHMTHVDVGQILAGKPLGGDNSVFIQIRGGIFNALGMGENNDLRKFAVDPVNTTKDTVNEALRKLGLPFRL